MDKNDFDAQMAAQGNSMNQSLGIFSVVTVGLILGALYLACAGFFGSTSWARIN